jgi:hypothetical protein
MVEKMGKIVGKIFIFFISCTTLFLDARVTLELRSEGVQNQVIVGQPFTLDVVIEDVYGSVQAPTIKGLDGFVAKRTGMYMSSINGKATTRYSYQVRIDTLGSYILGPAIVHHQQQEFVSHQLRITVVKDLGVTAQKNKGTSGTQSKAFLRLMIDGETAVVGQKMGCSLRFYYQDPSISLHNIGIPELSGFDIKEIGKLEAGTAEIDGSEYRYAQWQWDMYPTKPGEFIIPAYNADYDIPLKDNNHLLSGLFMFINNRVDRKRVYSNAATLKVSPLPHFDGQVHAVGSFERFSAEIKPGRAKEGDGMVLAIEIEGAGNLQAIAVPKLKMPDALKYYDSNSTIIPSQHSDELPKKRFEFIVQGMKSGDCEIPEQLFTYFDVERNMYTTLRTSPLAVSIMPGVTNIKKDSSTTVVANNSSSHASEDDIAAITLGQWYPVAQRQPLPWWLFELLFLLPCLYVGYPIILEKFILLTGNSARLRRQRAFKQAHKKIGHAMKLNHATTLYAIFMELFQQLNPALDMHFLIMRSLPENHSVQWNDFFEQITHAAYAQSDTKNTDELCRMAQQWLERLKKNI